MTLVNILYSGLGGHASVVFPLIEGDVKKEFKHVLIFYGIEDLPQAYSEKCNSLGIQYFVVKKKPGVDKGSIRQVKNILDNIRPAAVILHSVNLIIPVSAYCRKKKIRLIAAEHQANHLKTKKDWIWSYLVMLLADRVVYLTESYLQQMKKHLSVLFNSKKVKLINNGLNTSIFKPMMFNATNGLIFGMLSRLTDNKDHVTLIRAYKNYRDARPSEQSILKIAGDGPEMISIMKKIKDEGLENFVELPGMIPEKMAADFLNSLDIYIHASFGETMSTSIMQAMACKKTIIASDVPGINNMLSNGYTAALVPVRDPASLASEMISLSEDKARAEELALNAYNYAVEHYSNLKMFDSYKSLIFE